MRFFTRTQTRSKICGSMKFQELSVHDVTIAWRDNFDEQRLSSIFFRGD